MGAGTAIVFGIEKCKIILLHIIFILRDTALMSKKTTSRRHIRKDAEAFAPVNARPVHVRHTPQQLAALRQLFGITKH